MTKIRNLLIGVVPILVLVGSVALAAERKPPTDEQAVSATKSPQPKVNAQPQTNPLMPQSGTKAGQTQPPQTQPQVVGATTGPTAPPALNTALAPLSGEQIKWQVLSGGGNRSTSTNFILSATVGQTATGLVSSTNFKNNQGFWQNFSGGGCCVGLTGNVDCDGANGTDISDLSRLIDYLYISFSPLCCVQAANTDGDGGGGVDISDLSRLIDYLYISFVPTAACQ